MANSDQAQAQNADQASLSREDDLLAGAIPIEEVESQVQDAEAQDQSAPDHPGSNQSEPEDLEPIEIEEQTEGQSEADARGGTSSGRSIQAFSSGRRHEDNWNRTPNTPGTGAIHVKTFVAKLRLDAVEHMDEQVNQWLDAHPQYEVKFVTKAVGTLKGKTDEEALFLSVWV